MCGRARIRALKYPTASTHRAASIMSVQLPLRCADMHRIAAATRALHTTEELKLLSVQLRMLAQDIDKEVLNRANAARPRFPAHIAGPLVLDFLPDEALGRALCVAAEWRGFEWVLHEHQSGGRRATRARYAWIWQDGNFQPPRWRTTLCPHDCKLRWETSLYSNKLFLTARQPLGGRHIEGPFFRRDPTDWLERESPQGKRDEKASRKWSANREGDDKALILGRGLACDFMQKDHMRSALQFRLRLTKRHDDVTDACGLAILWHRGPYRGVGQCRIVEAFLWNSSGKSFSSCEIPQNLRELDVLERYPSDSEDEESDDEWMMTRSAEERLFASGELLEIAVTVRPGGRLRLTLSRVEDDLSRTRLATHLTSQRMFVKRGDYHVHDFDDGNFSIAPLVRLHESSAATLESHMAFRFPSAEYAKHFHRQSGEPRVTISPHGLERRNWISQND